ncbi:MAG: flagellar hook-length control protein FliK [Cellulosilyticaceae bacterium]
MNQGVMGLISGMKVAPQQGIKPAPKNDRSSFKKTMDAATHTAQKKPRFENRPDQMAKKERTDLLEKDELKEQVKSKDQTQARIPKEKVNDSESNVQENADQVARQMIPYLLGLIETLGISKEQLTNTFEQLGMMPEELVIQEKFTRFLQELVDGQQNLLTMDQETLKCIQEVWQSFDSIGQSAEGKQVIETILGKYQSTPQEDTLPREVSEAVQYQDITLKNEGIDQIGLIEGRVQGEGRIQNTDEGTQEQLHQESHPKQQVFESLLGVRPLVDNARQREEFISWQRGQEVKSLGEPTQTLSHKMVTEQLIRRLEIAKLVTHNEIQMELTPKELGKMTMKLVEQNGVVTAQIKVESDRTKEMMLQGLSELKEGLEKQGLTIGSFQVDVESHHTADQMKQQKQKSAKRIQEIITKHLEQIEEEAQTVSAAQSTATHTQVDYMA